jgi:regulator of protease activity HflC (stomatin/prohibitin superfamily)
MEEGISYAVIVPALIGFVIVLMSIKIVPEQQVWILQRLGEFSKKLVSGPHIILPFIDSVAYKYNLKEELIIINAEDAATKDSSFVELSGVLYIKVLDPISASYEITDLRYAINQLSQTTMRSEIGKIRLDEVFEKREELNSNILKAINKVAPNWGIQCMRFDIKDIILPASVRKEMDAKRVKILESEGYQQSQINHGEAHKRQLVLASDASYIDQINRGLGEAESLLKIAEATAKSIEIITKSMKSQGAKPETALSIAERSFEAIRKLIKEDSAKIVQPEVSDLCGVISKFLGVLGGIKLPRLEEKKPASESK